jgi:hypothetical protein
VRLIMNAATMKALLWMGCVILAGCAAPPPLVYDPVVPSVTSGFVVLDERPGSERQSADLGGGVISDPLWGMHDYGDEELQPDRIAWLAARLNAAAGLQLTNRTVRITRFTIRHDQRDFMLQKQKQDAMKQGARSMPGGMSIGEAVISMMIASVVTDAVTPEAKSPHLSAFDIAIQLSVDGHPFTSGTHHVYERATTGARDALSVAMQRAADDLMPALLAADLDAPWSPPAPASSAVPQMATPAVEAPPVVAETPEAPPPTSTPQDEADADESSSGSGNVWSPNAFEM